MAHTPPPPQDLRSSVNTHNHIAAWTCPGPSATASTDLTAVCPLFAADSPVFDGPEDPTAKQSSGPDSPAKMTLPAFRGNTTAGGLEGILSPPGRAGSSFRVELEGVAGGVEEREQHSKAVELMSGLMGLD